MNEREMWPDSDGNMRTPNEWGFNSFATAEGAKRSVADLGSSGSVWYIWRLADGTFDHTATANPDIPGHPAELVEVIEFQGPRGRRKMISRGVTREGEDG